MFNKVNLITEMPMRSAQCVIHLQVHQDKLTDRHCGCGLDFWTAKVFYMYRKDHYKQNHILTPLSKSVFPLSLTEMKDLSL